MIGKPVLEGSHLSTPVGSPLLVYQPGHFAAGRHQHAMAALVIEPLSFPGRQAGLLTFKPWSGLGVDRFDQVPVVEPENQRNAVTTVGQCRSSGTVVYG